MKLAIIGAGYVGLVTGACFAEMGNDVILVDVEVTKVEALDRENTHLRAGAGGLCQTQCPGQPPEVHYRPGQCGAAEPGLLHRGGHPPGPGRLGRPVHGPAGGPGDRPPHERLQGDRGEIHGAGGHRGPGAPGHPGELAARGEVLEFDVVSNPEFLKEGTALDDFMRPDRMVIGSDDDRVTELLRELYAPFDRTNEPMVVMDVRSAELTKYAANAMLATKISFINEMANFCAPGADIERVRQGIGSDPRIGYHFLYPGLGYGGSCFPKDVQALIQTARSRGYAPRILEATEAINQDQRRIFVEHIADYYHGDLKGRVFALWGLSFKPQTDNSREAPALALIAGLAATGARLSGPRPRGHRRPPANTWETSRPSVLPPPATRPWRGPMPSSSVPNWARFREPDFDRIKSLLKAPVIFDGRNLTPADKMAKLGFGYFYVGQPVNGQ